MCFFNLSSISSIFRAESLASEIKSLQGELADYNAVRSELNMKICNHLKSTQVKKYVFFYEMQLRRLQCNCTNWLMFLFTMVSVLTIMNVF